MRSYLGWKVDFASPEGEPALLAPDSLHWRVYKNPVALAIGGVAAVLLEFGDARIRSGVWDFSSFQRDPLGRARRTAMAAQIGVYAPQSAAVQVIARVNQMHKRVKGVTPDGEHYRADDPDLLDWVGATASYGFLTAYDRFAAPLSLREKRAFYRESACLSALYGARKTPAAPADFETMLAARATRLQPHPIVFAFLEILAHAPQAFGAAGIMGGVLGRAAVSLLPQAVRARLQLGPAHESSTWERAMLRGLAMTAEHVAAPHAPAVQACRRLGLPADYLYPSAAPFDARVGSFNSPAG